MRNQLGAGSLGPILSQCGFLFAWLEWNQLIAFDKSSIPSDVIADNIHIRCLTFQADHGPFNYSSGFLLNSAQYDCNAS